MSLVAKGQRHVNTKASKFAARTHQRIVLYNCWRPVWASTFLDIKFDAAMQQRFNRPARSWIFKWLGHVGIRLYAKGQVQVLQAWQTWETPFLHLIATQLAYKKAGRRFGTMPMFVKMAVTDIDRCDSCVMWQACAGYAKHLQNRSVSSVHWKWDKLTQGQLLVLHFAILHLVRTRAE